MNNREDEIQKCVEEIELICKKYNVKLDIEGSIDYDYNESPYFSGTSLILEDEVDGRYISWNYHDFLED